MDLQVIKPRQLTFEDIDTEILGKIEGDSGDVRSFAQPHRSIDSGRIVSPEEMDRSPQREEVSSSRDN